MRPWLTQVAAVTAFNLRSITQRLGSSLVTVVGVAGVVLVFVGVLSIASGFRATMTATGDPETVIVMRSGASSEMVSGLGLETTRIIAEKPGLARDADGRPLASAELFVVVDQPKKGVGTPANVPLRGVEEAAFEVRRGFRMVEGRRFEFGNNELIVGRGAAASFSGLEVGNEISWGEVSWTVVGIFETGGTAEDSELWCDARVLQPAYGRGSTFQSVHARLVSAAAFDDFARALEADPRLNVKVVREADYYAEQSTLMTQIIRGLGTLIALLMGFGAIFGALNTMYSAVAARGREIATLRALGFGAGPVVISVLVEALVLAAAGGVAGALSAYALFNGFEAATLNFQTFSQVAFAFAVTPALMLAGLLYALVMGLAGGLLPAVRAARLPVATALRQL
ncbi:MAG: ABC transporter permease [Acidobacteria bacterium]|nr:MAG: ABC transporter permease [Acidobacteriota bacterium]